MIREEKKICDFIPDLSAVQCFHYCTRILLQHIAVLRELFFFRNFANMIFVVCSLDALWFKNFSCLITQILLNRRKSTFLI